MYEIIYLNFNVLLLIFFPSLFWIQVLNFQFGNVIFFNLVLYHNEAVLSHQNECSEISNKYLTLNITPLLIMFFESYILKLGSSKKLRPRTFSFPYILTSLNYGNSTIWLRKVLYHILCLQVKHSMEYSAISFS